MSRPTTPSMGTTCSQRQCHGSRPKTAGRKASASSEPIQRRMPSRQAASASTSSPRRPAKGEQKRRNAQRLQQQIAQVSAEQADPVVRRSRAGGRVQRRVGGVIGGQREEKKQRDQQQHHPQKNIHGAAARGRENNADGLHDEGGSARRLPQTQNRQADGAGKTSQSNLLLSAAGGAD